MVKCPYGHKMEKKFSLSLDIAKVCPKGCFEFVNCRFNHDVSKCYWCLECKKHYQIKEAWSVS